MRKRIKKHIDEQNFIKVYISDNEGILLTHFNGIIFEQSEKFILLVDFQDFKFDGFVVVRKSDISELKRTNNEAFIDSIIEKEGVKNEVIKKAIALNFKLRSFGEMFEKLKDLGFAIIVERLYEKESKFQIGPVNKVENKKVYIDYINAKGEYDLKPITSKFKDITFFEFDSPYANMFLKYSKKID